jgi:hypothetical protein
MPRQKPTYTVKVHAQRLLKMLNRPNPCLCCPAQRKLAIGGYARDLWNQNSRPCTICRAFVGIKKGMCPCFHFSDKAEAIKRTWLALEEGGWI